MDITFPIRSRFLDACEDTIRRGLAELEAGGTVRVDLDKGGYAGRVLVTIRPDDTASFGTNWKGADPTRFPARIKAAAMALLKCGCVGPFEVTHADGVLEIRVSKHTVYLVSCVSQKREEPSPAKDLYVSDWFRKARRYAEASGSPWFVLSAKYGLVNPNEMVAPYERTLNTMSVADRRQWANRVLAQLDETAPGLGRAVFLAGKHYREFLVDQLGSRNVAVSVPMEGLRIGEQLSWLNQHTVGNRG